uniref:Uncharacterized protein n=1 Tax=Arundo donax TaxID=35708 RepID=A0A0A8Y0I7_ARUDO
MSRQDCISALPSSHIGLSPLTCEVAPASPSFVQLYPCVSLKHCGFRTNCKQLIPILLIAPKGSCFNITLIYLICSAITVSII